MQPLLSIVVPHYNHASVLPDLLDSILAQSLKAVEVLLVDDHSDISPEAVVEAYQTKGLQIRLLRNPVRSSTKNARLWGIKEAQAPIIATVDADDMLWGTTTLERHVNQMLSEKADILHYRTVLTTADHRFLSNFAWVDPCQSNLEGNNIFKEYARSGLRGFALWNKLYSKSLWMRFWDMAWENPIHVYIEDVYLNSLCMFHAKKYVSSPYVGYGWCHTGKRNADFQRRAAHSYYTMLRDLVPYFKEQAADQESIELFARHMRAYFCRCAGRWSLAAQQFSQTGTVQAELLDTKEQLKMLILATAINKMSLDTVTSHVL